MPNREEIAREMIPTNKYDEIRRKYLSELNEYTKRNTIVYGTCFSNSKMNFVKIPQSLVSINLDDVQGFMAALKDVKGKELDIILHSPGGQIEPTEQIVTYLRSKFDHIRAIIPQNAMSAATILACACDEIILAKHSALGPIDPQMTIPNQDGTLFPIPAQSILDEFEQAKKEVIKNHKVAALWVNRIKSYPHGFFDHCTHVINLSVNLVGSWLDQYMFKNAKVKNGAQIAKWLCDKKAHKTHGRPITFEKAQSIGLKVNLLENDQTLQEKVLSVYHAMMLTFENTGCVKMIENHNGKGYFQNIQIQQHIQPVPPATGK